MKESLISSDEGQAVPAQNSAGTGRQRGRPFQRGRSGNPGGRPKVAGDVRELLKQNSRAAASCVIALLKSSDERIALAAAREVLDRVLGRPSQTTEISGPGGGPLTVSETGPKRDYFNLSADETRLLDALLARLEGDFEPLEAFRRCYRMDAVSTLTEAEAEAVRAADEEARRELARRQKSKEVNA